MSIAEVKWQDTEPTLLSAQSNYIDDLQLQYDPFVVAPNLLYLSPRWEQHLDLLQHLSNNNNLLLVVVGCSGIGKTMFLEQFAAETIANPVISESDLINKTFHKSYHLLSDEQQQICQIAGDPALDQQSLIDLIVESFNLTRQPVENLQEQCEAIVEVLQQRPQRSLLMIDDAHLLPIGTLQAVLYLLHLQSDTKNQLHILLAGTESLRENFHHLAEQHANTDIVCIIDLEPLTRSETAHYLNHCLQQAGFSGENVFDDDEVEQIYNQSKGVPLQINHFARQLFIAAKQPIGDQKMNESIREFIEQHRTKLIGGGVLLLFVVALMWSMISSNPDKSNSSELVIDQSKVPQASVSESVAQQQQLTEMNQKSVAVTPPQSTVTPGNPQSQSPAASNGKTDTPAADANGVAMDDESTIATPATNTVPASPANPNKALNQSAQPMVSQPTQSANTVIKLAPVNTNSSTSNATTPVAANKKSKANKSTATKASAMGYRLQLIGLSDKKRLENFVQANHLQGKVDYLHTNKNGKDWYVVLYGHYATATQARHAINGLPKAVQTLNPWVRNMNATAAVQTAKSSHKASLKPAPVTKLSATTKTTTKVASTATSKKSVDTVKVTKAKVKVVASAVQKPKVAPAPAPKQTDNFIIDESIDG